MLFDKEFFIVLVLFMVSLVLAVSPPKRMGIINFAVGFVTVCVAVLVALGFTGATEVIEQYFMILVAVIGGYCALHGDGVIQ